MDSKFSLLINQFVLIFVIVMQLQSELFEMGSLRSNSATISSQNKSRSIGVYKAPTELSRVKKESQLMAKNPQRFLENIADGKYTPTPADTTSLKTMFGEVDKKTFSHYMNKAEDFQAKHKLSKTRTLLLNMTGNPEILKGRSSSNNNHSKKTGNYMGSAHSSGSRGSSSRPNGNNYRGMSSAGSSSGRSDWARGANNDDYFNNDNINKNNSEEVEKAIENFIDQIKNSDIDNIIVWINSLASMTDFKLPYGYPANLRMPTDSSSFKDQQIASFIDAAADEFYLLDGEYHTKLEEVTQRLKENFDAIQTSKWSPKDSALLYHIIVSLEEARGGKAADLFRSDLLRRLFPEFNVDQVSGHKYRLRMKKAWEEKRDNIIRDWIRDKEDLQTKTNAAWEALQEKQAKKEETNQKRIEQQEICTYWKDLLEKMRKDKRLKIRRIQIMVEPYEKTMEQRERTRVYEEECKRRQQRKLVEDFKRARSEKFERERQESKILEKQLEANAKLQAKYNKTRVIVRQFEYEKKQEAQKELERLKEEEKRLRAAILEKSKYKVEVDYDPTSILQDTHSTLIRRHEVQSLLENEEEMLMIKFFQERYSFSSETVMKDRKVRLETKLRDAGLIDTPYARQVLLALQPAAKPHLTSNIKFDDDK